MILLFRIVSKHRAQVVSSVLKCKNAMICLMEKTHVLDELHSSVVLLAMSSKLMYQQYMLNKLS